MTKAYSRGASPIPRLPTALRQSVLAVATAGLLLAGCGGSGLFVDQSGPITGFAGGAVADEPRAAIVARNILRGRGNAADAATALYFTLAVTYPSTASLGGGGQCLVYAPGEDDDRVEVLDFPARASAVPTPPGGRPSAVPGAIRGFFALHARYGRTPWSGLLAPAETLARIGHPVSRALVRDLSLAAGQLFNDPTMRAQFGRSDGTPVAEGQTIEQLDLGALLTQLRVKGPGEFYAGAGARRIVEAVTAAGGTLDLEELRAYQPVWRETVSLPFGNEVIHTAPPPAAGGITTAALWALAEDDDDAVTDAVPDARAHFLAEIGQRAFADRTQWLQGAAPPLDLARLDASMESFDPAAHTASQRLSPPPVARPENPAATSFVVVDREGMGVVCTVSMNNLFGNGRIAPGTGIVLAAPPRPDTPTSFAPVVMVNHVNQQLFLAAAATGGAAAPSALAQSMMALLLAERPLREALALPRLHHGGAPDRVAIEPGISAEARNGLASRGHQVVEVPEIGRVNAVYCQRGLPRAPELCRFENDRRGFGIATGGAR